MYLWEEEVKMPAFPALEGDVETDVLVIGGGMAGILCAYELKKRGVSCLLTERERIGTGTTRGTTAVVTAQHGSIYTALVKRFGKQTAKAYLDANLQAVEQYKVLAGQYEFDFEEKASYVYSMTDRNRQMLEAAILRELGADVEYTSEIELPLSIAGAVRFPRMAQMHPLKLIAALSKELDIREKTAVTHIKGHTAYTGRGTVTAKHIIVATRYPFLKLRGLFDIKLYQKRSFVVALEGAPQFGGTYGEEADGGMYMRNYKELLLVGGGDHRTGKGKGAGNSADGFAMVRRFVKEKFPNAREKYAWAAQDCISLDEVPYIGPYGKSLPGVLVITGFNEWGMTSAMAAASMLADRVTGKVNPFAQVFSPDRTILRKQLVINGMETAANFLKPSMKRCSHLGCALERNEEENTWDCPCHGSRFDEQGHVIDNPAMKQIRIKKYPHL